MSAYYLGAMRLVYMLSAYLLREHMLIVARQLLQTVTKIIAKTLYRRKGRCIIQIMGSANG